MKKLLILLGFCAMIMVLFIPQAQADERDIGYQVILPADHNAVIATDNCPAGITAPEFVVQVLHQDPGDMRMELRAQGSGLREESPAILSFPSEGDLTDYTFFRNRQCARLKYTTTRYRVTPAICSTSNGGAGY